MKEATWNRWSLLSGTIFVVLVTIAVVMVGQYEHLPPVDELAKFFSINAGRISTGGYIGTLAAFFLFWFAGSLRSVLRLSGTGESATADIAFGGAVAGGVLLAVAFSGLQGMALRAATAGGIGSDAVAVMNDSWSQMIGLAMPVGMAACCAATGLAIVRTGLLPAWFGWLSVILAVGLLTPFSYAVLALAILWTAVLSIWLFARAGGDSVATMGGSITVESTA